MSEPTEKLISGPWRVREFFMDKSICRTTIERLDGSQDVVEGDPLQERLKFEIFCRNCGEKMAHWSPSDSETVAVSSAAEYNFAGKECNSADCRNARLEIPTHKAAEREASNG